MFCSAADEVMATLDDVTVTSHLSSDQLTDVEQKPYMTSGLFAVVTRTYRSKTISR